MASTNADRELPAASAAIISESAPLTDAFDRAGHRLFLVGGIVRDLFLDVSIVDDPARLDLDFTTDARPEEVRRLIAPIVDNVWVQGERFGTIAAHLDGRLVEITTHRAEAYDPSSRKPDVVFADDVDVDLSRRDFTVNAMAVELTSGAPRLIDPYGGLDDLDARRLATPLSPDISFSDDPLRMLRAARFVARLGLRPDDGVVSAMRDMAERLSVVSAERIRDELDKLLLIDDPRPGLTLLLDTGVARRALPELAATHLDAVAAAPVDPLLRLATVLVRGGPSGARRRANELRRSRAETATVVGLVSALEPVLEPGRSWSDGDLRRLVAAGRDRLDDLPALLRAVGRTTGGDELARRLVALGEFEDLRDLQPPLDGAAVMTLLGIGPGPEIGAALDVLREARLDNGPMDREQAERRLDEWWSTRTPTA